MHSYQKIMRKWQQTGRGELTHTPFHIRLDAEKKAQLESLCQRFPRLSKDEIIELIVNRSKEIPNGEWIFASGWDEAEFANEYPDMNLLSKKTPNHPVVLVGLRGFGVMGNQLAFEKAGITQKTRAKDGGEVLKDSKGNLRYVLLNSAKKLLLDKIPEKTLQQQIRIMNYGFQELMKLGFTTTHNLGVDKNHMNVYEDLLAKNALPMRTHAFIAARMYNIDLVNEWLRKGPTNDEFRILIPSNKIQEAKDLVKTF